MRSRAHLTPELKRALIAGCALLGALGCTSPHRDLGRTADEMRDARKNWECEEETAGAVAELEPLQAEFLADFVGSWLGYAEDALGSVDERGALPIYAFPSGSTRILLEVSQQQRVTATLTLGAEQELPAPEPGLPAEGFAYPAQPVASALDVARTGADEAGGEPLAHDGKLVLAFSIEAGAVSELQLRFGAEGLVGVFDGLSLLNERGFLTRPGSVRLRRLTTGSD